MIIYKDIPKYTLETPMGAFEVLTHKNAAIFRTDDAIINGVGYSLSVTLTKLDETNADHRHPSTLEMNVGQKYIVNQPYYDIYSTRRDSFTDRLSESALNKVKTVLLPLFRKWIDENPDAMLEGAKIEVNNDLYRLETEIGSKAAELAKLETKRQELEQLSASLEG